MLCVYDFNEFSYLCKKKLNIRTVKDLNKVLKASKITIEQLYCVLNDGWINLTNHRENA